MTTIQETVGRTFIAVKIISETPTELGSRVEKYFRDFPEPGYMTTVKGEGTVDGKYYADLIRLASCD